MTRMHKWLVAGVLVVCAALYWLPAVALLLFYGMGEPGAARGFGPLFVMWSVGEWFRTIWVFTRPRKSGESPAGERWLAALIIIIGSTIGAVTGLFVGTSLASGEDAVICGAASVVIASHWLGRRYLHSASPHHY